MSQIQYYLSLPEPLTDTVIGITIKGCVTSVIQCLSNSSVIEFSTKFACFKDDILFFKIIGVGKVSNGILYPKLMTFIIKSLAKRTFFQNNEFFLRFPLTFIRL